MTCTAARAAHKTTTTGTSEVARMPMKPTSTPSVSVPSHDKRSDRAAHSSTTNARAYPRANAGVQTSCSAVGSKAPDCPTDGQ